MRFQRIIAISIALLLTFSLCGCGFKSDEEMIEDRMNSFQSAYNTGDMEGVLECFDAKTRNTYKSALNVGSALIGITGFNVNMADLFGLGIAVMDEDELLHFDEMEISVISDNRAKVTVTTYYRGDDSGNSSQTTFTLVKESGDWYIAG